jgi:EAL domain-containing protein (putative c-di-GMP-specific phosphodiesterase class I)
VYIETLREVPRSPSSLRVGDPAHTASLRRRKRVLQGLADHEFTLAYQAIVDARGHAVVGAEALLRWQHPERGWLQPGAFIEALEEDPQVAWAATAFVVEQIAADLTALPKARRCSFVSFNAYPSQLLDGKLRNLLETHYLARGCAPEALFIELLETESLPPFDQLVDEIKALRAMGFRIAIDDFGCGSWTLHDLVHIEVDAVKLARELLRDVPSSEASTDVVLGALRILKALDTQVIVEGVETPEQATWVSGIPQAWAQGYLFARPAPGLPRL